MAAAHGFGLSHRGLFQSQHDNISTNLASVGGSLSLKEHLYLMNII